MAEPIFDEGGISVDAEFVRFGNVAMRVSEIKVVSAATRRTDGHWVPILWVFAVISLLFSFGAPIIWFFVVGFTLAAIHKGANPAPVLHMLRTSTGGIMNSHIYETTDGEQIDRLRLAIEKVVSADQNAAPGLR